MLYPRRPQSPDGTVTAPPPIGTTATSLAINSDASSNPSQSPVPLTGTAPLTVTLTSSSSSSAALSTQSTDATATATPTDPISTATVIGAVVGSVAFLSFVLTLVVWYNRRTRSKPKNGNIHKTRNWERRQSKRETWKTLEAFEDGEPDMKLKPVNSAYPPLPSAVMLREKQIGGLGDDGAPQLLPLPPVSPLPFASKFDPLMKRATPSPDPTPIPHPYANRNLQVPRSVSPVYEHSADKVKPKAKPAPLPVQSEYHAFEHPYAVATPLHRGFAASPQGATHLLPDADDQSFYSMDSPSPGIGNSFADQQQRQDIDRRDSFIRNNNPFFTAHPGSQHDGPEKWGLVGKARTVEHARTPSHTSAMENLIAALSLGPSPSDSVSVQPNSTLNRSQHGHLGSSLLVAPSPSPSPSPSDNENENPFEFDEVYGQDIAFSALPSSTKLDPSFTRESSGNLSTGMSLEDDGPSPGLFPMPPR